VTPREKKLRFDEIGYWSEIKLEIVKDYASEYSKILVAQKSKVSLEHVYIDAFAGAGVHLSKYDKSKFIAGSPLNALAIDPPFKRFYLIDLDSKKVEHLKSLVADRSDVEILHGDCNEVLKKYVFPNVRYDRFQRGLCLLDPYGLHLDWEVIEEAGKMLSLEIFLNFPIADMNRNVLWHDRKDVDPEDIARMNSFWGDDSWQKSAYRQDLFGYDLKEGNTAIAKAFQERLKKIAGFKYVSEPLPMRNSQRAIVYYLFFASHKPVATKIVDHIFNKYLERGL